MSAQPIIKHFYILKDVLGRLVPCAVLAMVDEFLLQCPEEALHAGIVPTVPPSRHAAGHAMRGEQLLVRRGGILAAAIRMVQEPCLGFPVR